jgi:hypothetical protein
LLRFFSKLLGNWKRTTPITTTNNLRKQCAVPSITQDCAEIDLDLKRLVLTLCYIFLIFWQKLKHKLWQKWGTTDRGTPAAWTKTRKHKVYEDSIYKVAQWVRSLVLTAHTSISPIRRGFAPSFVNYRKLCTRLAAASDKFYQLLVQGRWFSPGTPASSTTKTGRHGIAEILLISVNLAIFKG